MDAMEQQQTSRERWPAHKMKTVYAITDRGEKRKSRFTRVGVGFINHDDSITIKLDALPTSGTLQVRPYVPFGETEPGRKAQTEGRDPWPSGTSFIGPAPGEPGSDAEPF